MNLKLKVLLIMFIFLLSGFLQYSQSSQDKQSNANTSNSGIINGISWEYTTEKDRIRVSSLSVSDSATIFKSKTVPKDINTNIQIITGIKNVDFYYNRYVKFVMKDGDNSSYTQEKGWGIKGAIGNVTGNVDNVLTAATNSFYRYDWAKQYIFSFNKSKLLGQAILGLAGGPLKLYSGNIYVGNALTSSWFTTNVTIQEVDNVSVPLLDIFQQKYGEITVPEVNITYLFDQNQTPGNLNDDQLILIETLVPAYQLISVQTQLYPVNIKQNTVTYASLTGSYNFTGSYNENTIGDEVRISDGNNFIFGWYGLESTTVNYNQSGGFTIQGSLDWNVTNDITFTNGTKVSEDVRLPWWRSSNMTFDGIWSTKFTEQGTIVGKAALQSIVEAIRTRASTASQDQLLVWANIIPSTMFGFIDSDNSGDASVRLNGSTLEILDQIMAVGLTQGVSLKQNTNYTNFVNANAFWQLGNNVLTDKAENNLTSGTSILDEIWGADPNGSDFSGSTVDFNWITPTVQNSKVNFNWSIGYNSFPTTWSATDGQTGVLNQIVPMDIGYSYSLTVDPTTGQADLSNTYDNSGISNATVKSLITNLNFATYKRDYFLGMQRASDSADSTQANNEGTLSTSFGTTNIINQVFGETKQQYALSDGAKFHSQTTIVNVLTGTGTSGVPESVNVSSYSPFASGWFANAVGLSLLKWSADNRTQNSGVDWKFRENLVITSYPTWKGLGIVHDPSYSTVYTPSTQISSSTEQSSETINSKGADWNFYSIMLAFVCIGIVSRLKIKNNRKF